MAEMKTYSDDEMKHLVRALKNDNHKLLEKIGLMSNYVCYVGNSNLHVKHLMRCDCNPYAIFMTIRMYNKMVKASPEKFIKENNFIYYLFENQRYEVMRINDEVV